MGERSRYLSTLISLLALIGQLLLPVAHAELMAQRSGAATTSSFCGQLSPGLLHKLAQTAPPELLKRVRFDQQNLAKMSCELCVAGHGSHLASLPSPAFHVFSDLEFADAADIAASQPFVRFVRLPELRGPPPRLS